MKCVRTGSAQGTAQLFGEKQRVEKMTYNCEAGCCCDRLASSQGADQVFEPWAMVLLQSAHLTTTSFRYTWLAWNGGAFTFKLPYCAPNWTR